MKYADSAFLEYAARSLEFVEEDTAAGREEFLRDRRIRDAVLYRLQTLTQALGDVSAELRARYPDVPWRAMRGFRNVLVHDFIGIDTEVVWGVVQTHLPLLKPQIRRMLDDQNKNAG